MVYAVRPAAAMAATLFPADVEAVFSTRGSHAGSARLTTSTSLVNVGRAEPVVCIWTTAAGALVGRLDDCLTTLSRSCAEVETVNDTAATAHTETRAMLRIVVKLKNSFRDVGRKKRLFEEMARWPAYL